MEAFRGQMNALLSSSSSSTSSWAVPHLAQVGGGDLAADREHMFDKVVTPSDVGKLNRLVIPKQHAERFFPLEPSSADKGLVLSFEDRCGKQWSFRYSYWNSSQSYVITKGWSRFVKEKRLDAGDTVSFSRARADEVGGRQLPGRLFIDLHHRSKLQRPPPPPLLPPPPPLQPISFAQARHPLLLTAPWLYYRPGLGFPAPRSGTDSGEGEVVLESVPVVFAGVAKAKRVRLFGVNLDCPDPGEGSGGGGGGQLLLPALTRPLPTWQRRAGAEAATADVTEKKIVQSSMYIHFGGEQESQEIKENMKRFDLI